MIDALAVWYETESRVGSVIVDTSVFVADGTGVHVVFVVGVMPMGAVDAGAVVIASSTAANTICWTILACWNSIVFPIFNAPIFFNCL